jgi:hypothetical protein
MLYDIDLILRGICVEVVWVLVVGGEEFWDGVKGVVVLLVAEDWLDIDQTLAHLDLVCNVHILIVL